MKTLIAAGILALFANQAAFGASTFGVPDCGLWIKDPGKARMEAWLLGYLTGMNMMYDAQAPGDQDPLGLLDSADQAILYVTKYCSENPLKRVNHGATQLFRELIEMPQKETGTAK